MTAARRFGLVQARLQARLAALPDEPTWERLSAARSLSAFLEEGRRTSLRSWLRGFSPLSDAHDLERGLRNQFRDTVDAVAGWAPRPWRAAVAWTRWLPYLPLFAHLQGADEVPSWMREDLFLRALLDENGRPGVCSWFGPGAARAGAAPPGMSGPDSAATDASLGTLWWREWRARWPRCGRACRHELAALIALLTAYGVGAVAPAGGLVARRELRARLHGRFHRALLQPATVFTFLALLALDLERLRGELVARALFAAESN